VTASCLLGLFGSGYAGLGILERVALADDDFNTEEFPPGAGGEGSLYRTLLEECKLDVSR